MARIVTDTTHYRFAHGKEPRGYGHWFLEFCITDGHGRWTEEMIDGQGTLSEVRELAIRDIRNRIGGASIASCVVLP